MKKFLLIIFVVSLFLGLSGKQGYTQFSDDIPRDEFPSFDNVKKVAQTGYQFLKIEADARGAAMGGAAITMEGSASSVFWNPAGLTSVSNRSVFVGYTQWFADMQYQAFAAAINFNQYGVLGISGLNLDHGNIQGTAISNNNIGYEDTDLLDVAEMAFGLTYAKRFTDNFGLGITAKYCRQDLEVRESSVIAFDVGTIYNTGWNDVKISVSAQHFARELKYINEYYELPLVYRVGVSADILSMAGAPRENHQWTVALEGVNPRDYSERVHLGSEYWYNNMFAIRAGYKFNYDTESFSFGAGLRLMGFQFDYALSDFGAILGIVNRFSAQINF